jgi:hypothetical protein
VNEAANPMRFFSQKDSASGLSNLNKKRIFHSLRMTHLHTHLSPKSDALDFPQFAALARFGSAQYIIPTSS